MPNDNLVVIAAMARKGGSGKTTLSRALISAAVACLLYTSPSPRDRQKSRMPSSA